MNLTNDQKHKLRGILDNAKTQRETIYKDFNLTDEQKKEELKNLRTWTRSNVEDLLTPEQRNRLVTKVKVAAKARSMRNSR
jgi:uncharacterized protein (DUF2384 family)